MMRTRRLRCAPMPRLLLARSALLPTSYRVSKTPLLTLSLVFVSRCKLVCLLPCLLAYLRAYLLVCFLVCIPLLLPFWLMSYVTSGLIIFYLITLLVVCLLLHLPACLVCLLVLNCTRSNVFKTSTFLDGAEYPLTEQILAVSLPRW